MGTLSRCPTKNILVSQAKHHKSGPRIFLRLISFFPKSYQTKITVVILYLQIVTNLNKNSKYIGGKAGRVAKIFNYLNGLELKKAYSVSPFNEISTYRSFFFSNAYYV